MPLAVAFAMISLDLIGLFFRAAWDTVLSHGIWIPIILFVVACVLWPAAVLGFVRSRAGMATCAACLAIAIGWEARAYLDSSIALRRELAARIEASAAEKAAAADKVRRAEALAAEQRRQAEAQRAVATSAALNEAAARQDADHLQEQVDDYAQQLATDKDKRARLRCALSDADARRLRGIGAARGGRAP